MYLTNGKNKAAICAECKQVILRQQGYRYYMNKLFHDRCRDSFMQKQLSYKHKLAI